MDIRDSGKRNAIITVHNFPEQAALVYARPKPFIELSISFGYGDQLEPMTDETSESEPYGNKYPFELELSVRSLKKIRKCLSEEKTPPKDESLVFGRIAVSTTIDEYLQGHRQ